MTTTVKPGAGRNACPYLYGDQAAAVARTLAGRPVRAHPRHRGVRTARRRLPRCPRRVAVVPGSDVGGERRRANAKDRPASWTSPRARCASPTSSSWTPTPSTRPPVNLLSGEFVFTVQRTAGVIRQESLAHFYKNMICPTAIVSGSVWITGLQREGKAGGRVGACPMTLYEERQVGLS
jgi:hypothetical protein